MGNNYRCTSSIVGQLLEWTGSCAGRFEGRTWCSGMLLLMGTLQFAILYWVTAITEWNCRQSGMKSSPKTPPARWFGPWFAVCRCGWSSSTRATTPRRCSTTCPPSPRPRTWPARGWSWRGWTSVCRRLNYLQSSKISAYQASASCIGTARTCKVCVSTIKRTDLQLIAT